MSVKGNAESYAELRGSLSLPDMIRGYSAYEIAVAHGFDGTEEEWLASLHGGVGIASIEQTSKSTVSDGVNEIAIKLTDGRVFTFIVRNGSRGSKGDKGDPPTKGIDYWTAADKAEIKAYVDEAILKGEW